MSKQTFWTMGRRKLVARAWMNLFQALAIGFFVTETYFKASRLWKAVFLVAMAASFAAGVLTWPAEADDVKGDE